MRRTTTLIATAALFATMAQISPAVAESKTSSVTLGSIGAVDELSPPVTRTEILDSSDLPGDGFRVRDVRVQVENVSHTNPSDFDLGLYLISFGFGTMLLSDAGGNGFVATDADINGDFTFDNDAIAVPNDDTPLASGTFVPSDFDSFLENDLPGEATGFGPPFLGVPSLDPLDGVDPVLLRGPWSITAADDSLNGESGSMGSTSVVIRMDRPDVDTLVATPNPAQQNEPATVTATATAFGLGCTVDAATGYQFDLDGDGDFGDANEGPGTNTRPLNTTTSGPREITVRATQTGCPSGGAFRDRSLNFDVEPADAVATCAGQVATHQGTDSPETIVGTAGNDVIAGLGGGDVILSLGGNDIVCGGDGGDLIKGDGGKDKLYGEGGSDILKGGRDRDVCIGGLGVDRAKKCEKTGSI